MKLLNDILNKIKNKFVTAVICGGNFNGSVVILIFENRYSLCIQCAWRLTDQEKVLASWNEADNSIGSHFQLDVSSLEGDFLLDIVSNNFFDLQLKFDSGRIFFVFCDISTFNSEDNFDENWYLSDKIENLSYVIGRDHEIFQTNYGNPKSDI